MPTIRWVGPTGASATTDYRIESDEATPGTFAMLATQDATTPYVSDAATLADDIAKGAQSIPFDDATDFADGNYAIIDREMYLLDGKSADTFAESTPGVGNTTQQAHSAGAAIFKAHESYPDSPTWGSRHVITYRVIRIEGSDESVAVEAIAVNPTAPPTSNVCTLWGILEWFGERQAGKVVSLQILDGDNYVASTGEQVYRKEKEYTTSAEGYWEITGVPRDIDRIGGDILRVTIDKGGVGEEVIDLRTIPNKNTVNIWECV